MSVCDPCIVRLTPNLLLYASWASGLWWPTSPGLRPYSSEVTIRTCIKHFVTRRGPRFSLINKTRHLPSGRSTWAKAKARLIVEQLAAIPDLSAATTTTLAGVRPLAGGSSHL
jgi:hypothetical protein